MSHGLEDNHQTNPPLTLDERRALLRAAVKSSGPGAVEDFVTAVEGADENDRAALSQTLPASKLFQAEGPTPRACFVLAALGKPAMAAELLSEHNVLTFPVALQSAATKKPDILDMWSTQHDAALMGVTGRSDTWCHEFIDAVPVWNWDRTWNLIYPLVSTRSLFPESEGYLLQFAHQATFDPDSKYGRDRRTGRQIADFLRSEERFLSHEFWTLFRVEGLGNQYSDCYDPAWDEALLILCDEVPGFRARLLDESLQALLRDFAPKNVGWYQRVHRLLDPTPDEVAARAGSYLAVLGVDLSTSVGLAQEMLKRAVGNIDPAGLLDASETVLRRTEKKLVKAQLGLLRTLVKTDPSAAAQVSKIVSGVLDDLPADVAASARRLVVTKNVSAEPATGTSGSFAGSVNTPSGPVVVPPPRQHSLPAFPANLQPVTDERELWELVDACLEGTGNGANLPRILSYLRDHPDVTSQATLKRAQKTISTIRKRAFDSWSTVPLTDSPRQQMAVLLLSRAGYKAKYTPCRGTIPKLLADQIALAGNNSMQKPAPSETMLITAPLPGVSHSWERTLSIFNNSVYMPSIMKELGLNADPPVIPVPVWLTSGESQDESEDSSTHKSDQGLSWTDRAYNVSGIPDEYASRADEARHQDAYEQVVQWAAWLYANNPDILAAQFHPLLWGATTEAGVRGVLPLLEALGKSYQLPNGPVYSALCLGLSAKQADHRAAAAEAVATMCEHGLLVPESFATEIAAHLADGFVLAGRLATALSDAASINPIAGYRVLQTLSAVLPHLDGVNQAAKLVELTAKLSADYGTPVLIPETLASKTKGSSLMAVSLRLLADVRPAPTALLQAAAEQAAASLEE